MKNLLLFLFVPFLIFSSEIPNFDDLSRCKECVFLLTTPKSGSNLVSASLSAITRRPISWIRWGNNALKKHPSYNRLCLPLVSNKPLLYRTHYELDELIQIPSTGNKLIFLTRNPKELLFRAYRLTLSEKEEPDFLFIENFLNEYFEPFRVYQSWDERNRMLIYYEDFIAGCDQILLDILHFMQVEPTYFADFITNKENYLKQLLESYKKQHEQNKGGLSSIKGPQALFYSKGVSFETLSWIDHYIASVEPNLWEYYLKRFESRKDEN